MPLLPGVVPDESLAQRPVRSIPRRREGKRGADAATYGETVDRPRHPRVLVAGDEYYAVLAAVRGLRRAGYEPWLAGDSPRTCAARSRTIVGFLQVPDPATGIERFVADLAAHAER